MLSLRTTVVACTLLAAMPVVAHDAWVDAKPGATHDILYGHKDPEAYPSKKVTSLKAWDASQKEVPFDRIESAKGLAIKAKADVAMYVLDFDNGYWTKVGKESKNIGKKEAPNGTGSSHPLKFSKTIIKWEPWTTRPVGQRIEIIPMIERAPKANSNMPVLLLLDGKPLANQMIENNSNEKGPKTDAQGKATVKVVKGVNRFATDHDIALKDDPNADKLSLTAALVFIAQ